MIYFIFTGEIELIRGIQTNLNNGEFVLILRTDGRIVAMSDEVEHHLGKTMVKELSSKKISKNKFSSSVHSTLNASIFSNVSIKSMEENYKQFFHPRMIWQQTNIDLFAPFGYLKVNDQVAHAKT